MRALLCSLVLVAACSSGSASVDVTMTFDSTISDSALAQVASIVVSATADETTTFPITLGRAAMREERLVYRPAPNARSLSIVVDALSASGSVIATGTGGPVTVRPHGGVSLAITLAQPTAVVTDLGAADLGVSDMSASHDAAQPISPSFINDTIQSTTDGTTIVATVPSGSDNTVLLLAMVGGTNPNDTTLVSFTAPAGWNALANAASATAPPASVTWFWRFGEASSPASYTFTRNVPGPTLALVASYRNVTFSSGAQFDSPFTQVNASGSAADIPSIHTNNDFELVIVNAFAADDFQDTFSNPVGLVARQTSQALSADLTTTSHGDSAETSSTLGQASRTLVLVTGLNPMP